MCDVCGCFLDMCMRICVSACVHYVSAQVLHVCVFMWACRQCIHVCVHMHEHTLCGMHQCACIYVCECGVSIVHLSCVQTYMRMLMCKFLMCMCICTCVNLCVYLLHFGG